MAHFVTSLSSNYSIPITRDITPPTVRWPNQLAVRWTDQAQNTVRRIDWRDSIYATCGPIRENISITF